MDKTLIRSSANEIIYKVFKRFLAELEAGAILSYLNAVYKRTAEITGKSVSSLTNCTRRTKAQMCFLHTRETGISNKKNLHSESFINYYHTFNIKNMKVCHVDLGEMVLATFFETSKMLIFVNMANELEEFDKNIENIKSNIRASFARIYASLKARELKTLRQLDAIRKQCEDDKDLKRNCVQNIHICFDNESTLLNNVSNYGIIDFERLNFDSNTFTLEDYVCPEDDHMYSYKTIEELTKEVGNDDLGDIEEAAMKEVTATEDCVCFVNIKRDEVSKKFRDLDANTSPVNLCVNNDSVCSSSEVECLESVTEGDKSDSSDVDVKKIDPTDDWLNSIKSQTETEPSQADAMEHSTIACL